MKNRFLLLSILFFSSCAIDIDGPELLSISPAFGEMVQDRKPIIEVRFDEPIAPATAIDAFSLSEDNGGKISGDVTVSNRTIYFTPDNELNGGSIFRITIATSLEDIHGNKFTTEYYSRFQIGTNSIPPAAIFLNPTNMEHRSNLTNSIVVAFSRAMDTRSARENISLTPQVDGQFIWNTATNILTFVPMKPLSAATHYTFTLKPDLCDTEGVRLGRDSTLYFTTGTNFFQPAVLGIFQYGDFLPYPQRFWTNYYNDGRREDALVICFDQPMDRVLAESAFSITPSVDGYFSWDRQADGTSTYHQLLFHPVTPFSPGINYQATVASSAKGENGLTLTGDYQLHFSVSTNYLVRISTISNIADIMMTNKMITEISAVSNTTFFIKFSTFTNAPMDIVTVQLNISVSRLFGAGNNSFGGAIRGFNWSLGGSMLELEVDSISSSNVYLLTIKGGQDGVKDVSGNWLPESQEVLFRVQ